MIRSNNSLSLPAEIKILCGASVAAVVGFVAYSVADPSTRHLVGGDFSGFYIPGGILGERLYDLRLQKELFQALTGRAEELPYMHAPFFAALFWPLSRLPFLAAYAAWLSISVVLYVSGIVMIVPKRVRASALWLGLAFPVFVTDTFMAGQVSAVNFFAIAAALALDRKGRFFWSGFALGICVHKPPLLLWVVPMLIVTRSWRSLAGLFASVTALLAISWALVGGSASLEFVRLMFSWLDTVTTAKAKLVPRYWKHVDLNSFAKVGFEPWIGRAISVAASVLVLVVTVRAWKRSPRDLVWASTLVATLLVNVYTPFYESILVVIALIAAFERDRSRWYGLFLFAFFAAGWVSQAVASSGGPQVFTMILVAFAVRLHCLEGRRCQTTAEPPGMLLATET